MADANRGAAITKLHRIRKTVAEMLEDRGYVVSREFKNETRAQFEAAFEQAQQDGVGRERFVILCGHKDDPENKILVYFPHLLATINFDAQFDFGYCSF